MKKPGIYLLAMGGVAAPSAQAEPPAAEELAARLSLTKASALEET